MSISISNNFQENLVSVIVPTRNRSHFLQEAIQSVELQEYRPIELIVIDDGSTDRTKQVVELWQNKSCGDRDFTVHYFYQDKKGAPSARNIGLMRSKGEYIQYLDSDDLLHPLKIAIHVSALNSNEKCEYVWSNHEIFKDRNEVQPIEYQIDTLVANEPQAIVSKIMQIPRTCWSGLYRRSLCINAGFWNEDLVRWQDFEYNVRISYLKPLCKYIDAKLYFWRTHNTGSITDLNSNILGIQEAFKTLRLIESLLIDNNLELDVSINNQLWLFYFLIVKESLEHGNPEQIHNALKICLKYRHDFPFRIKVALIRLSLYFLGQNTTRYFLNKFFIL